MQIIPFSPPDITDEDISGVVETLKSGWITTGKKTKLFEQKIAQYCHTQKAVCLNSATACMELTLRILGIGPGDEVITTAYTYTASASVICHVGATPVLVDVSKNSFCMDYEALYDAITEKTKAIICVDIAGVMCDYTEVFNIVQAKKNVFTPENLIQTAYGRIIVIADAAHSFGATQNGKMSGEVADFTCFSFHAVKNITTAEGGAVTWKGISDDFNDEVYKEYSLLSLHGQTKDALSKEKAGAWEYDIISPSYKCNMTDIAASLGLTQLKRYTQILRKRHEIVSLYNKGLLDLEIQCIKHESDTFCSSAHLFLTRLIERDEDYRNLVIKRMSDYGISTNVHYKPLPMFTAYKRLGFSIKDYPNAYETYSNEITLPLNTVMSYEDVYFVIEILKKILRGL